MSLSIVIITLNEASTLRACLESVAFADEVLVLDSGSSDDTVSIATQQGAKVFTYDWPGDGPQRNRGIELAQSDWVLCLDADERLSPTLQKTLPALLRSTDKAGFAIAFVSHYLGQPIRFGDWRNEKHIRLFRKGKGNYSSTNVYGAQGAHCRPVVEGELGFIADPILHYPFRSLNQVLEKLNRYSSGSAEIKRLQGRKGGIAVGLLHGIWAFIRGYILRFGFLDGKAGFLLAMSNSLGSFYRYVKIAYPPS